MLVGCSPLGSYQSSLKNSDELMMYTVMPTPTAQESQTNQNNYLNGYQVMNPVFLARYEQDRLRQALSQRGSIGKQDQEDCPFIAKYGVVMDDGTALVIGNYSCGGSGISIASKSGKNELYSLSKEVEDALSSLAYTN
ncbi:MAG TPA: hypothetical protein DCE41_31950 [Cytophagales bacterium]|nr:hypothetical protein [Cytophagales bacterium]